MYNLELNKAIDQIKYWYDTYHIYTELSSLAEAVKTELRRLNVDGV